MAHALDPRIADRLRTDERGLLPVVVQSMESAEVLMLAWMDLEALNRTMVSGRATYWSRSRGEYWVKGETSGNRQQVVEILLDCDGDTLLMRVAQTGPACHTGSPTCFVTTLLPEPSATTASAPPAGSAES